MKTIPELIKDELVVGDDGYTVYWPRKNCGAFNSRILREIADELDRINKPHDEDINNYFNQEKLND